MGGTLQNLQNALYEMDRLDAADIVRQAKSCDTIAGLYNEDIFLADNLHLLC